MRVTVDCQLKIGLTALRTLLATHDLFNTSQLTRQPTCFVCRIVQQSSPSMAGCAYAL